jgi:cyclopropane fatty-acyl-phospholipid synthase-like methyltransferase
MADLDVAYWDGWYAGLHGHPVIEAAKRRHLGLPDELLSTSLLSMTGLEEVDDLLGLDPDHRLLDLACGRGGYGLWLARSSGCRLIGVDLSPAAIGMAGELAGRLGLDHDRVEFRTGLLEATGLPDGCVDAALVVDAIQFAGSTPGAATECLRVLRPGGRVVMTCWEARVRGDEHVAPRLRDLDLVDALSDGGFVDVDEVSPEQWREAERAYWTEAAATDPGDDPALRSWHDEAVRSLANFHHLRRVLVTGLAP